jgi:hypothetical protein
MYPEPGIPLRDLVISTDGAVFAASNRKETGVIGRRLENPAKAPQAVC